MTRVHRPATSPSVLRRLVLAGLAVLVAACSSAVPVPTGTRAEGVVWAGSLRAHPVPGPQPRIAISGKVGSITGATLVGAETPYGPADLTATTGCAGDGAEPMSSWTIDPHGSITLALGARHLLVAEASGLPEPGSRMTVVLRFADADDFRVTATVQPLEEDASPGGAGCED